MFRGWSTIENMKRKGREVVRTLGESRGENKLDLRLSVNRWLGKTTAAHLQEP